MRLLFDCVVLRVLPDALSAPEKLPSLQVIDAILYGEDDVFEAKTGMQIRSGARIVSGSALLRIENCLE